MFFFRYFTFKRFLWDIKTIKIEQINGIIIEGDTLIKTREFLIISRNLLEGGKIFITKLVYKDKETPTQETF